MAPSSKTPEELLAQAEELEQNLTSMSPASYDAMSRKMMRYSSPSSGRRRKRPGA